jgi:hypothetical protein
MGKNFSKNQHFADFSACSGHPALNIDTYLEYDTSFFISSFSSRQEAKVGAIENVIIV